MNRKIIFFITFFIMLFNTTVFANVSFESMLWHDLDFLLKYYSDNDQKCDLTGDKLKDLSPNYPIVLKVTDASPSSGTSNKVYFSKDSNLKIYIEDQTDSTTKQYKYHLSSNCIYYGYSEFIDIYGEDRYSEYSYAFSNTNLFSVLSEDNVRFSIVKGKVDFYDYKTKEFLYSKDSSKVDIDNVNTYPLNHIEIVEPKENGKFNFTDSHAGIPMISYVVRGKIAVKQEGAYKINKSYIEKAIYNNDRFYLNGEDRTEYCQPNGGLTLYGSPQTWANLGYYTFEYKFKSPCQMSTDDIKKVTYGCSYYSNTVDSQYIWVSDTVNFSTSFYVDMNGDGKDDDTGEDIPLNQTPIDDTHRKPPSTSEEQNPLSWLTYWVGSFFDMLNNLFNNITEFFKSCVNAISSISSVSAGMASNFTALFSFLPKPIPELISTAFVIIIFVCVLKFIRG